MPQLQVIQRQEDPTVKQLSDVGNEVADSITKAKTLQATRHYYDILGKNAETEQGKMEIEQKKQYLDLMDRAQKITDPQVRQAVVTAGLKVLHAGHGSGGMDIMSQVGDDLAQTMKTIKPDTGAASPEQLQGAQMRQAQAEADLKKYQGGAIRRAMGLDENGAPIQAAVGAPTSSGGTSPSGFMLGDMNIAGMNFINPEAESAKAGATARGTELAKKAIAHQQFTRDFEDFKALNDQIPRTDGTMGIAGRLVRGAQTAYSGWDQGTHEGAIIASYNAASKRLATTLARQVDVGNLSATEQDAASKMVPSKYDSAETNKIKMAFMEDMNRAIGSNEPSQLKGIIENYKDKLGTAATNGSRSAALGGGGTPKKVGRFTIEEVK